MIRSYSILSTNGELQSSPYIHELSRTYDIQLTVHKPRTVTFLLQYPIDKTQLKRIQVIYDTDSLELTNVSIEAYRYQTLVSMAITTKDIGSFKISFAIPQDILRYKKESTFLKNVPVTV